MLAIFLVHKTGYTWCMEKNISIIGILLACVILVGGLFAMTRPAAAPEILSTDQAALLAVQSNDHTVGPKDAKVTVVEYYDFECPPCGAYHPILTELEKQHPDVQFVYRYFPLSGHLNAMHAALAAEAAAAQGKFTEMKRAIFEHQDEWGGKDVADASLFVKYAQEIGLNIEKWEADRNSDAVKTRVEDSLKTGVTVGVRGTPTFYLNGAPLETPRSLEEFSQVLTAAKTAAPTATE